jgi:ADP-heptose:LPS heptosyltransferase
LAREGYDAAFEPRGDARHLWALYRAGIPLRIGHGVTGGGFLLTHCVGWEPRLHEQDQALRLAEATRVPPGRQSKKAFLRLPLEARREADALARALGLGPNTVMVQAGCGTSAKRWSPEAWASLLNRLGGRHRICFLGSVAERDENLALAARLKRPAALATGRLGLGGLAAFLAKARLLISVDSGPAHLAALQGVPVLSLFSGTNRVSQWGPRGAKVVTLQAPPPACSPCELAECPFDNACMEALGVDAVLARVRRILAAA